MRAWRGVFRIDQETACPYLCTALSAHIYDTPCMFSAWLAMAAGMRTSSQTNKPANSWLGLKVSCVP